MVTELRQKRGFTIVELLVVIVIIGILAALVIVAYNGMQDRAYNAKLQLEVKSVQKMVEAYAASSDDGLYPSTGGLHTIRTDDNCAVGTSQEDWVPGVVIKDLPQSQQGHISVRNGQGCFLYASDGVSYFISAWNLVRGGPQASTMYKRLGGREYGWMNSNYYLCNHPYIGGVTDDIYNINHDHYKRSYTVANITSCNETPPSGA